MGIFSTSTSTHRP